MSVEGNDGRGLEQLVSLIEGQLAPRGFRIEVRKPAYNEAGTQVAEFDILIGGNVGSASLSCLIECRDRPSEGPAPAAWVEQLIGRRARFRLDKVMAVSSTGFSQGAIDAAADARIELRALQRLTPEEVTEWLPQKAPVVFRDGKFKAVRVYIRVTEVEQEGRRAIPVDQPFFVTGGSARMMSILELWKTLINLDSLWGGIPEGGPPVESTVVASDHLSEEFTANIDGLLHQVERVEFDAILHAYFPLMSLVEVGEYSSVVANPHAKQTYARLGRWKGPDDAPINEVIFIGYLKKTGSDDA